MTPSAKDVIAFFDSLKKKSNPIVGIKGTTYKTRLERTAKHFKISRYQVTKILSICR